MPRVLNGVKLPHFKNTENSETVVMPAPKTVRIAMSQHIGTPCEPIVAKGDTVKAGQKIADSEALFSAPIHASVSGVVSAIEEMVMPNGCFSKVIVITADAEQQMDENLQPPQISDFDSFIKAVRESGLVGLGGAGFPTHVKFSPKNKGDVKTLVINGAECEPYITSDYMTMIEQFDDLYTGIKNTMEYLNLERCIIGVEDHKPAAIEKLKTSVPSGLNVEVITLPSSYPQGAEKVLIYSTMNGLVVPQGKLPADVGAIVSNVTTIAELGKYIKTGIPLISKRVTLDGSAIKYPKNILVPIGTSIADLIEYSGGYKDDPAKVLMGGPMMGLAMETENYPLLKNNNAIIALTKKEATTYQETPCIRCGDCMRACPMGLMPFRMKSATKNEDMEMLKKLKASLCIECGSCSYVCNASQELVHSHRKAKKLMMDAKKKEEAKKEKSKAKNQEKE